MKAQRMLGERPVLRRRVESLGRTYQSPGRCIWLDNCDDLDFTSLWSLIFVIFAMHQDGYFMM